MLLELSCKQNKFISVIAVKPFQIGLLFLKTMTQADLTRLIEDGTVTGEGIQKYELNEVTADFKQFHIGDTVPPLYLTPEYNIKQWQLRNLPAPDAGTRWTYMGGNYVLIGDADGKISKIYDGEIFYHR